MNVLTISASRLGPRLGTLIAGCLPRSASKRLASFITDRIARRENLALVQSVRSNQAVVRGLARDDPRLGDCVAEVLGTAGRSYVDFYWTLARGSRALQDTCYLTAPFEQELQRGQESGRGMVIVGPHMDSFDLLLLSVLAKGYRGLALAFPEIQGSYSVLNQIRRQYGLDVMPISVPALRAAIRHLRSGGMVLTGVDRPVPGGELLTFFGRPALMPTGYSRLAVRTGAYVLAGVCQSDGRGGHRVIGSQLIDPHEFGDDEGASTRLAQHVLSILEGYIRQRPGEWLMFFPVWPEDA